MRANLLVGIAVSLLSTVLIGCHHATPTAKPTDRETSTAPEMQKHVVIHYGDALRVMARELAPRSEQLAERSAVRVRDATPLPFDYSALAKLIRKAMARDTMAVYECLHGGPEPSPDDAVNVMVIISSGKQLGVDRMDIVLDAQQLTEASQFGGLSIPDADVSMLGSGTGGSTPGISIRYRN